MLYDVIPSLPHRAVKTALCGENDAVQALEKLGISVIPVKTDERLPKPVSNHADMLCCHISERVIFSYDRTLVQKLLPLGIECRVSKHIPSDVYPLDAALNCARIGNLFAANTKTADKDVLDAAHEGSLEFVNVRQGYTRCSVAIVDECSVITSDLGVAQQLEKHGVDVLLIRPGYISLPGYDYGFIGGACGKTAPDTMFFAGDPNRHPDGKEISSFLSSKKVKIVHTQGDLLDFGGFIPVKC